MRQPHLRCLLLLLTLLAVRPAGAGIEDSVQFLRTHAQYVDVSTIPGVSVQLRYASSNNFIGTDLYGPLQQAFLHRDAAARLQAAARLLQQARPGFRLLVLDAARPRSVQQRLWHQVEGTPRQRYVANPARGSMHNFGLAVDLTVIDAEGRELDMGTPFDSFEALAQPAQEQAFLAAGRLTAEQLANRRLLRDAMVSAGFIQLPLEWWHFDALPAREVKARYPILE